jgi:hypothetical protein
MEHIAMILIEVWTQWPNQQAPRRRRTYAVDSVEQLQAGNVWHTIRDEPYLVGAYLYEKVDDVPYHDRRIGTITRTSFVLTQG